MLDVARQTILDDEEIRQHRKFTLECLDGDKPNVAMSSDPMDDSFIETLHARLHSLSTTITTENTGEEVMDTENTTPSLEQATIGNSSPRPSEEMQLYNSGSMAQRARCYPQQDDLRACVEDELLNNPNYTIAGSIQYSRHKPMPVKTQLGNEQFHPEYLRQNQRNHRGSLVDDFPEVLQEKQSRHKYPRAAHVTVALSLPESEALGLYSKPTSSGRIGEPSYFTHLPQEGPRELPPKSGKHSELSGQRPLLRARPHPHASPIGDPAPLRDYHYDELVHIVALMEPPSREAPPVPKSLVRNNTVPQKYGRLSGAYASNKHEIDSGEDITEDEHQATKWFHNTAQAKRFERKTAPAALPQVHVEVEQRPNAFQRFFRTKKSISASKTYRATPATIALQQTIAGPSTISTYRGVQSAAVVHPSTRRARSPLAPVTATQTKQALMSRRAQSKQPRVESVSDEEDGEPWHLRNWI
jgi:hypothetical protein